MNIIKKDKEPITLHTANKYCKEDINVIIESDELTIKPNIEEQTFEGIFDKVNVSKITSDLIPNLKPENIAEGEEILDLIGTHKGETEVRLPIELTNINGTIQIKLNKKNFFNISDEKETRAQTHVYHYYLKPNTNYTISTNCPYSKNANVFVNSTNAGIKAYINNPMTIQSNEIGYFFIAIRYLPLSEDTTTFNLYEKVLDGTYWVQIEEESQATEYEPYTQIQLIDDKTAIIKPSNTNQILIENSDYNYSKYVNFVESTSNKYMTTNLQIFSYTSWEIELIYEPTSFYDNNYIINNSSGYETQRAWINSSGKLIFSCNGYNTSPVQLNLNKKYKIKFKYGTNSEVYIDDVLVSSYSKVGSLNPSGLTTTYLRFLTLGRGKIYGAKVYGNGSLLRNYTVKTDTDGVNYLYDTITGESVKFTI